MNRTADKIVEALGFTEKNLREEITVLNMAGSSGYSLYHFIRLFEGITGHSPKEYILRRRITEAARELKESNRKLIDIALDYQFGSPESFTRAFRRVAGMNPSEYRKSAGFIRSGFLNPIDAKSIANNLILRETEYEVVTMSRMYIAGMVEFVGEDKSVIDRLWKRAGRELEKVEERRVNSRYAGISFWSDDYDVNGFYLMAGVEVDSIRGITGMLVTKEIPECRYLKFIHRGSVMNLQKTWDYIFQTFLPKNDYELIHPFDIEVYDPSAGNPWSEDNITEIYLPVK